MKYFSRAACLVTTLILVAANVNAFAEPGERASIVASTVIQDSDEAFEVQAELSDGQTRSLTCRRLGSDLEQEEWSVALDNGSGTGLSAWIVASMDRVVMSGTVGSTPFVYTATEIAPNVFAEVRTFGTARFSSERNLSDLADARNARWIQQFQRFSFAAAREPGWDIIRDMNADLEEVLANSSYPDSIGRAARVATSAIGTVGDSRAIGMTGSSEVAGLAADRRNSGLEGGISPVGTGPGPLSIHSYVQCLKAACHDDGGEWSEGFVSIAGCHASADPLHIRIFEFLLYTVDAETCFFNAIRDLIVPFFPKPNGLDNEMTSLQ